MREAETILLCVVRRRAIKVVTAATDLQAVYRAEARRAVKVLYLLES